MARGGMRPGSGRPAKGLAELEVTGSYRPARHAHLLKSEFRPTAAAAWIPDPADLATLGEAGRTFVERLVAANELSDREGSVAMELGHVRDALVSVRSVPREGLDLKDRAQRDRIEANWLRVYASLMQLLRVTP